MDKEYEQKYHSTEETNWWFQSRRHTLLSMLENIPKDAKIIDIGCSGGVLMQVLKSKGYTNLTGIDFSPEAIEKCKKNGLDNCFVMDAHYPAFEEESFDFVIASDCLEHLKDDRIALSNWYRILKTGGVAVIFVPAFMSLWSEHDVINQHFRRYKRKELVEKSKAAGFKVLKNSYWNFLIFFPAFLFRKIRNIFSDSKENPKDHINSFNPTLNKLLISWLSFENIFFNTTGFPIGVSVMVQLTKEK